MEINNKDLIEKDEISNGGIPIKLNISNILNKSPDKIHIDENESNQKNKPKTESEDFKMKKIDQNNFVKNADSYIKTKMMKKITLRGIKNNIEKFRLPPELKKTYIVTFILSALGIILIICGFIKAISDRTPGGGIMFWVLGGIVIIPGGFYCYQFYKAKHAKQRYERKLILDNIPQL